MKLKTILAITLCLAFYSKANAQKIKLKTAEDSLAYAMAVNDAIDITKKNGLSTEDFNVKVYLKSLEMLLNGKITNKYSILDFLSVFEISKKGKEDCN